MYLVTHHYASRNHVAWHDALLALGAQSGPLVRNGESWRLVTAMFLHANSIHLIGNMFALRLCGLSAEKIFGSLRYAAIYLLAGLAGGVLSVAMHPEGTSIGASGAIFGVFGAVLAYLTHEPGDFSIRWAARLGGTLLSIVVTNLLIGWIHPWIDNSAHLGGLAGGFVAGWLMARGASRRMALNDGR